MNRRGFFTLPAIATLGLAFIPGSVVAQEGALKQQLVGTWTLASYETTATDGTKRQIANPKGILVFDAGGRYVMAGGRGDRPKFRSGSQPTTEELAAATTDFFAANFGSWSVSEADKMLTQRFEGALRPNNEGTDVKSSVSLTGDELMLTNVVTLPTGARTVQTYRRAK
jgi:hypothetical protein